MILSWIKFLLTTKMDTIKAQYFHWDMKLEQQHRDNDKLTRVILPTAREKALLYTG